MRTDRLLIATVMSVMIGVVGAGPLLAQQAVQVTTPYPAVLVEAGESVVFELDVTGPSGQRVDLSVTRKPRGWQSTLRGGGFVIDGVTTSRSNPPDVQLEIDVPAGARAGRYPVTVTASSLGGQGAPSSTRRRIDLIIES